MVRCNRRVHHSARKHWSFPACSSLAPLHGGRRSLCHRRPRKFHQRRRISWRRESSLVPGHVRLHGPGVVRIEGMAVVAPMGDSRPPIHCQPSAFKTLAQNCPRPPSCPRSQPYPWEQQHSTKGDSPSTPAMGHATRRALHGHSHLDPHRPLPATLGARFRPQRTRGLRSRFGRPLWKPSLAFPGLRAPRRGRGSRICHKRSTGVHADGCACSRSPRRSVLYLWPTEPPFTPAHSPGSSP